jgi:ABC-type transporter Mla subunit MlaD
MTGAQNPKTTDDPRGAREPYWSDVSLGIFTSVSIVLLVWGYCWLKTYHSLRPPQRFGVIFPEVAGLNENAAVYVDGVRVGSVEKIEWKGKHDVRVQMRIYPSILQVPVGSRFEILTNGIVGAKYVQIDLPSLDGSDKDIQLLDDHSIVYGDLPVRPELAVNKLAITLGDIDMHQVGQDFKADRARLIRASDHLAVLADKAIPAIDKVIPLETDVSALTKDLRRVSKRAADAMDNPAFASDLKDTARLARETVQNLHATMRDLSTTLGDRPMRQDVIQALQQLNQSTSNVASSLYTLQKMSGDVELRSDLKQIIREAHSTLNTVNEITSKPMGTNLRDTLQKTSDVLTHLDLCARQLNQILDKRSPLMHLVFGRPGRIKGERESNPPTIDPAARPMGEIHDTIDDHAMISD